MVFLTFACSFPPFLPGVPSLRAGGQFCSWQDFEPASLSKDGWHPEWPMMKEPMIVPLVRDSEVLLVARSSVNCNRTPSFIKFLFSKPEGRRPKRLHKNNQASVFVEYSWSFFHPQHFWCVNHVSTRSVVAYFSNLLLPWAVESLFEKNLPWQPPRTFGEVVDLPHFKLDKSVIDVVQRGLWMWHFHLQLRLYNMSNKHRTCHRRVPKLWLQNNLAQAQAMNISVNAERFAMLL